MWFWVLLIIIAIWWISSSSSSSGKIHSSPSPSSLAQKIEKHNKRIREIETSKIGSERRDFARDISIGKKLYDYFDTFQYYPVWMKNQPIEDGKPYWKSTIISPEDLTMVTSRDVPGDSSWFEGSDEVLSLQFGEVGNKLFIDRKGSYGSDDFIGDSDPTIYYTVIVISGIDNNVLLQGKLSETLGQYTEGYSSFRIQQFRPDNRLVELYVLIDAALEEKRVQREKDEVKRKEEDAKNFI